MSNGREARCGNCRFFELGGDDYQSGVGIPDGEPLAGFCKRLPPGLPTLIDLGDSVGEVDREQKADEVAAAIPWGQWPVVLESETPCGEHSFVPAVRQMGPAEAEEGAGDA